MESARGQDDRLIDRAEVAVHREDGASLDNGQGIREAVTEVEGILETRSRRDSRLFDVRRHEADAAVQEAGCELVMELRLPVADSDQHLGDIDRAHPELGGSLIELPGGPGSARLFEEDRENDRSVDDQRSAPEVVVGAEARMRILRRLASGAEPFRVVAGAGASRFPLEGLANRETERLRSRGQATNIHEAVQRLFKLGGDL